MAANSCVAAFVLPGISEAIDPMFALAADLEFIVYERQIDSIESQPID